MLIANSIDQKFLEAILAEQQKTNELLEQLLHSMRKSEGVVEPKVKPAKPKVVKPKSEKPKGEKPKRGNGNAKVK